MEVDVVDLQLAPALDSEALSPTEFVEETPQEAPATNEPESADTEPPPGDGEQNNAEDIEGVIRLLQEGHFKGVADIRLRINHFDKLSAIEQEELQAAIEEEIGVLESMEQSVAQLLGYTEDPTSQQEQGADIVSENLGQPTPPDGLTEEQKEAADVVSGKVGEVLNSDGLTKNVLLTLVSDLKSALVTLVDSLNSAIPATTTELPEESTTSAEDGGEEAPVTNIADGQGEAEASTSESPSAFESLVAAFVEEVNSVFMAALDELVSRLNEVEILPELSGSNGNGSAYDKFLAVYTELWGVETPDDGPSLDIVT